MVSPESLPEFMVELDPSLPSLWFCDNRLTMQAGPEGPRHLDYYSPKGYSTEAQHVLSTQGNDFLECLRPNVRVGFERYAAEEGSLAVSPFGYCREQTCDGLQIRTGVWLTEDCVIFSFDLGGKAGDDTAAEIVIWPQCFMGTWQPWRRNSQSWTRTKTQVSPDGKARVRTCISLAASGRLDMREYREKIDSHGSGKYRFSTRLRTGRTSYIVLAVGSTPAEALVKGRRVAVGAGRVLAEQFSRYRQVVKRSPRLKSPSPMLDRFIRFAPLYQEAMKITDTPGARRAKTSNYWVWLWDAALPGMVDPYLGDGKASIDMSRFFAKHLHLRGRVPFAFGLKSSALPKRKIIANEGDPSVAVQGLVEILAFDAAALTGRTDVVSGQYPLLRKHFAGIAGTTIGQTGLHPGVTAFPDARRLLDETDDGVSSYNNACWYNACRKMERLALGMGDDATAAQARRIALAIEKNFWPVFWNVQEGYAAASADSQGRQRDVYFNGSTFFDFGYGDELCDGYKRLLCDYQLSHFYSRMGISIFSPKHPRLWDRDGNQFHCSWPVLDSHCLKLAVWSRNRAALAHFVPWVDSLLARHTVPEAIQMRVRKDFPAVYDPGAWQAYTTSSWCRVVVECLLGVAMDEGGLTVTGTTAPPMQLDGLHYRGGRVDVRTEGIGWDVARVVLDGKEVRGTNKVAASMLEGGRHSLRVVRRSTPPRAWRVLSANGSAVEVLRARRSSLRFTMTGTGLSRALIFAPGLWLVTIGGRPATHRPAERPGTHWVEIVLSHRQKVNVEATGR